MFAPLIVLLTTAYVRSVHHVRVELNLAEDRNTT